MRTHNAAEKQRRQPMAVVDKHFVNGKPIVGPFPEHLETAIFGMGCFWGVEKRFWELEGVYTTAVGYAGGNLVHPTYRDVCNGNSGHAEVVLVVYDAAVIRYDQLLKSFCEGHDPTRGSSQGNDPGSQYRSIIVATSSRQAIAASRSLERYRERLAVSGRITTEIGLELPFYYAEDKHQQYLAKHQRDYRGTGGTDVTSPFLNTAVGSSGLT